MSYPQTPYYFVCTRCDAKWFGNRPLARCPRCRRRCRSEEQIVPPWWRWNGAAEDLHQDRGALDQAVESPRIMVNVPKDVNMKELTTNQEQNQTTEDQQPMPENLSTNHEVDEERKLRRAYCEQLRRMACPGCGEGEPQF
jgi:hypothetical protein